MVDDKNFHNNDAADAAVALCVCYPSNAHVLQ